VNTPPTEAEIRAALVDGPTGWGTWEDGWSALMTALDDLYETDDFRKSEQARLDELVPGRVEPIRDRARREVREAIVEAGLQFAREHPDAPRSRVPETVA